MLQQSGRVVGMGQDGLTWLGSTFSDLACFRKHLEGRQFTMSNAIFENAHLTSRYWQVQRWVSDES